MTFPTTHSQGFNNAPLEAKSVRELQSLARDAAARRRLHPQRNSRNALSRAAQLYLIDLLSRLAGAGLALIAGASIFLAVVAGQAAPMRAGVWAVMVFAALYLARRFRKEFRSGEQIASHPFRWRANYTSSMAVLGAAFGSGAILLLPPPTQSAAALQALGLMLAAGLGAAALHTPHPKTAAAIGTPIILFTLFGATKSLGFGIAFFAMLGISAGAVIGLIYLGRRMAATALTRFPRTTFVRRELETDGGASSTSLEGQAAKAV